MKAFITGVTGFVGSHLAEHLLACGDTVAGSTHAGRWPAGTPEALPSQVPLVRWDAEDFDGNEELITFLLTFQADVIYHLAGLCVPAECGDKEPNARAIAINVAGGALLIGACTNLGLALDPSTVRPARLILASTSHVYPLPQDSATRFTEDTPAAPRNGYGKSKQQIEALCSGMAKKGQLDVVIVRGFMQTGPRQMPNMMLPSWAQQFARGDDPVQPRNLDTTIDLTDVRDAVRAYRLLALHGKSGEVFNLGSGVARKTGEVFDLLRSLADPQGKRRVVETHPGTRHDPIANIDRLTARTGWRPEIPLETTVADTLADWRRRELC